MSQIILRMNNELWVVKDYEKWKRSSEIPKEVYDEIDEMFI